MHLVLLWEESHDINYERSSLAKITRRPKLVTSVANDSTLASIVPIIALGLIHLVVRALMRLGKTKEAV